MTVMSTLAVELEKCLLHVLYSDKQQFESSLDYAESQYFMIKGYGGRFKERMTK